MEGTPDFPTSRYWEMWVRWTSKPLKRRGWMEIYSREAPHELRRCLEKEKWVGGNPPFLSGPVRAHDYPGLAKVSHFLTPLHVWMAGSSGEGGSTKFRVGWLTWFSRKIFGASWSPDWGFGMGGNASGQWVRFHIMEEALGGAGSAANWWWHWKSRTVLSFLFCKKERRSG